MRIRIDDLQGAAIRALLRHIETHARALRLRRISLETGTPAAFHPAHALYRSEGYLECEPFADYQPDSFSVFMTKELG